MPSNFTTLDPDLGYDVDLDDYFITDAWIIDRYVGNELWTWGNNTNGQLGLNDLTARSSPVQMGRLVNWTAIAGGGGNLGMIRGDGTLWMVGTNTNGQLGQNNTTSRSSPVQVGLLTNWKQVDVAPDTSFVHTLAVKTDGTLWAWGLNTDGQLGQGNTTNRSSPVQVGLLTSWKQCATGIGSSFSVTQVGSLWSWGDNAEGQLGQNDRTHRSSPVQVGSLTNWKSVAAGTQSVAAIKTDGTLWAWGHNNIGQLGLNDSTHRSSPAQVGALTNWKQVDIRGTIAASIKYDGTLWTWGNNQQGVLGLGDTGVLRSSPTQVGALTNWKQVSVDGTLATFQSMSAVKNDGTLWAWGSGANGRIVPNDLTHRSSPTQIGSLTNWKFVETFGSTSMAATTYTQE